MHVLCNWTDSRDTISHRWNRPWDGSCGAGVSPLLAICPIVVSAIRIIAMAKIEWRWDVSIPLWHFTSAFQDIHLSKTMYGHICHDGGLAVTAELFFHAGNWRLLRLEVLWAVMCRQLLGFLNFYVTGVCRRLLFACMREREHYYDSTEHSIPHITKKEKLK